MELCAVKLMAKKLGLRSQKQAGIYTYCTNVLNIQALRYYIDKFQILPSIVSCHLGPTQCF